MFSSYKIKYSSKSSENPGGDKVWPSFVFSPFFSFSSRPSSIGDTEKPPYNIVLVYLSFNFSFQAIKRFILDALHNHPVPQQPCPWP